MTDKLIIVESPAKANTIKKFLGGNTKVMASMGHIRDLPKSKLGIDVEHNFEPEYINIRGKGDLIKDLKKNAKNSKKVYLATDPDREGEAIAWHLSNILNSENNQITRVTFNEITKNAVQKAIKHALQMSEMVVPDFVCAHGTGTLKNDEMEALAIHNLIPNAYVCSTKTVTGHTLGGAGALCAAAALFSLDTQKLPTHLIEDNVDPLIATIKLTVKAATSGAISSVLCNSFAFGGNNAVIVIKKNNNAAH